MTQTEAKEMILSLIREGYLIGVEVGADSSFGLSDMFGPWAVGSDCNAAEPYLMRPSRDLFGDDIHAALTDESYGVWTGDQSHNEFDRMNPVSPPP